MKTILILTSLFFFSAISSQAAIQDLPNARFEYSVATHALSVEVEKNKHCVAVTDDPQIRDLLSFKKIRGLGNALLDDQDMFLDLFLAKPATMVFTKEEYEMAMARAENITFHLNLKGRFQQSHVFCLFHITEAEQI
jgi:hypothetical protein